MHGAKQWTENKITVEFMVLSHTGANTSSAVHKHAYDKHKNDEGQSKLRITAQHCLAQG